MKISIRILFVSLACILILTFAGGGKNPMAGVSGGTTEEDTSLPEEVTGLSASGGDTQVTLSWTNPGDSDFSHCRVWYGTEGSAGTEFTGSISSTGTTITELTNGTEYTFTVKTVDTSGNVSDGVSTTATPAVPPPPPSDTTEESSDQESPTGGSDDSDSTTYTVSGRVSDAVTGDGISNANILLGSYSTTTDSTGNFTIEVTSSSTVTGDFYVYKGLEYQPGVEQEISIDPITNPNYEIALDRNDTSTYSAVTLSGTLAPDAEESNKSLMVEVYNTKGGMSYIQNPSFQDIDTDPEYEEYSVTTSTFGSDCMVVIKYDYDTDDSNPKTIYYVNNVDLSTDATLDIDTTNISSDTVTITNNNPEAGEYRALLYTSKYGVIVDYPSTGLSVSANSSAQIEFDNPDGYDVVLYFLIPVANDPSPDHSSYYIAYTDRISYSTSMTLSQLLSVDNTTPPGEGFNASIATYTEPTLSFDSAPDAMNYHFLMEDDNGNFGWFFLTSSSIDFADGFITDVLDAGTGWDLTAEWSFAGYFDSFPTAEERIVRTRTENPLVDWKDMKIKYAMDEPGKMSKEDIIS